MRKAEAFVGVLAIISSLLTASAPVQSYAATAVSFTADIWADNWFALYVNGKKVAEDSTPLSTTKSFNKETVNFSATYPLTIGIVGKDYVENQSGLEYINTPRQQLGDAGLIAQVRETKSQKLVTATDKNWKSFLVNRAPTNPECVSSTNPTSACKAENHAVPKNWSSSMVQTSKWPKAIEYSEAQVSPKDEYFDVKWDSTAKLIWSTSLTQDNVVLFRTQVAKSAELSSSTTASSASFKLFAPDIAGSNQLSIDNSCDGKGVSPALAWQNPPAGTKSFALLLDTKPGPARPGEKTQTDFSHWVLFNIPAASRSIASNSSAGAVGKNFKGTPGYAPPCSQGPGLKIYTAHLYAINSLLSLSSPTGPELQKSIQSKSLAEATLELSYSRQ